MIDTDDFGYPVLGGRYAFNPEFRLHFRSDCPQEHQLHVRRRLANMLAAYAHPSCVAVLFRSEATARSAHEWIRALRAGADGDSFLGKIQVAYPAQKPCQRAELERKWRADGGLQIVFCGRDFETKNGRLALETFAKLSAEFPHVSFVHVGVIPHAERVASQQALRHVRCLGIVDRHELLSILGESHVLFHPSRFESVGIILLEAAAAGLAVVTAKGGGMSNISELFDHRSGLFVDRDTVAASDEPAAFLSCLRTLLASRDLAKSIAYHNYEACVNGRLSIGRRDATLQRVYEKAREHSGIGLSIDTLPALADASVVTLDSEAVQRASLEAHSALGLHERVDFKEDISNAGIACG